MKSTVTYVNNPFIIYILRNVKSVMYHQRSKFELYLELLTQIKYGNCEDVELMKCTRLPPPAFYQNMAPLLSEALLKRVTRDNVQGNQTFYQVTDKGEQFIEFLQMALNYVELKSDDEKKLGELGN